MKLSEDLQKARVDRPDEWTMDRFIKKAVELERSPQADTVLPVDSQTTGYGAWLDFETVKPNDSKDKIVHSTSRGVGFAWCNKLGNQWFFHDNNAPGSGYYLKDVDYWMELPAAP